MDMGSDIKEKKNARFPDEFKGHVELKNVTFSYGDEDVLNNIDIEVKPGSTLGLDFFDARSAGGRVRNKASVI